MRESNKKIIELFLDGVRESGLEKVFPALCARDGGAIARGSINFYVNSYKHKTGAKIYTRTNEHGQLVAGVRP